MENDKTWGIEQIKIIKDFLSPEEIKFYINYINDNFDIFIKNGINGEKRAVLMFGKDNSHKEKSEKNLKKINNIENVLRKDLFPRVEQKIKEVYKNDKDLMVSSFFMAKQTSGAKISEHIDTDGGANLQYKYGGVIYLNKMNNGGKLEFPEFNYSYNPEPGDFVVFPSRPKEYRHKVSEIYEDRYSLPIWVTEYSFWKL